VSPAQAAHLRLMHSIPKERIRTHELEAPVNRGWCTPIPEWKIDEMVRLKEAGRSWSQIAKELDVSECSVWNHLKKRGLVKKQKHKRKK
jgi:DNA-binding NarL/FixJ family response regulator